MEHSAIKMTPKEAMKEKSERKVKQIMSSQAIRTRKYPELSVGNTVKTCRKRKQGEKDRVSMWRLQIEEVESIEPK